MIDRKNSTTDLPITLRRNHFVLSNPGEGKKMDNRLRMKNVYISVIQDKFDSLNMITLRDAITSRFLPPNLLSLSCLLVLLRAFECAHALHFLVLLLSNFNFRYFFSLIFSPFIKLIVIFELNCPFRTDMVRGKK